MLTKIVFTSCCKLREVGGQNAYHEILKEKPKPNWLVLLGDNVYPTKTEEGHLKHYRLTPDQIFAPWYQQLFHEPSFAELLNRLDGQWLATWDDHDFGWDDVYGAEQGQSGYRDRSRAAFLQHMSGFIANRTNIYHSVKVADNVRIVIIDARSYRTSPKYAKPRTLLGEKQEEWLLEQLREPERIKIIGSGSCLGLRVKSLSHRIRDKEGWNHYQDWFKTFTEAVRQHHKAGKRIIFLSGDLHQNGFLDHSRDDIPIFEAISSGAGLRNMLRTPLKNYGVLEIDDEAIAVRLKGTRTWDRISKQIDIVNWTLF